MVFPPDFTYPDEKAITAQCAAGSIAALASERRTVVQAGGCSGLWPLALAQYFGHVYTFEPDPVNYQCLQANVANVPTITARQCALGAAHAQVGMVRPKPQAGLWRVEGEGEIPMVTLDFALGETVVDALVLDVEGLEAEALRGAERLIAAHRPVLWFEFLHNMAAIGDVLAAYGYRRPMRGIGGDCYSLPLSRVMH